MASKEHVAHCFDVLIASLRDPSTKNLPEFKCASEEKYPLFVTWTTNHGKQKHYRLRGCIGTFSAQPLPKGLREYALTSALRDSRFSPIAIHEVPHLKCDVSLLMNFTLAKDLDDWTVGEHGITIEWTDPSRGKCFSATYLPEVAKEQGWDREETLQELIVKAGWTKPVTKELRELVSLTRYESSKASLTYDEYLEHRTSTALPVPSPSAGPAVTLEAGTRGRRLVN